MAITGHSLSRQTCLDYVYSLDQTIGCTGFASCMPIPEPVFGEGLELLADRPRDTFLRQFLLRKMGDMDMTASLTFYMGGHDPKILGPMAGIIVEYTGAAGKTILGPGYDATVAMARSYGTLPASYGSPKPAPEKSRWRSFFKANIHAHIKEDSTLPPISTLFGECALKAEQEQIASHQGLLAQKRGKFINNMEPEDAIAPKLTYARAMRALEKANLLAGPEMRHEASLSPIALLRNWRLELKVKNGRIAHTLSGTATSYGRGLSLAGARAACAMEIVERASAYASIEEGGLWGHGRVAKTKNGLSLRLATWAWLRQNNIPALDPAVLCDRPESRHTFLHWVAGTDANGQTVLAPAQAVFLFCNLDEEDYISASSTGLAAGNTLEHARLSALAEILERDAHATTPFLPEKCFRLAARDARINSLLLDYRARNIHIRFQDISREDGFPIYRCFTQSREGDVVQSTGAGLNGQKAILSALTETPWPYVWAKPAPFGKPTSRAMENIPTRFLEDLPDFSLPSARASLELVENMLKEQGKTPVYMDITRADLDLPVVRAIIPGALADTDGPDFPPRRLAARWLAAQQKL